MELIEKVLEGNIGQGLGLSSYVYVLLCLNGLVKAVRITAARHNTPGKLVYNKDFTVFYHIVLIPEHQVIGTKSKNNIMLNFQILRIRQILNMEKLLNLSYALLGQVYNLILFIYDKVPGLCDFLTHNSI